MTETPEGVVVTPADAEFAQRFGDTWLDGSRVAITALADQVARHRLAHTPTLRGEEVERLREAAKAALLTLRHARVFIGSRQKMHPDGQALYDADVADLDAALGSAQEGAPPADASATPHETLGAYVGPTSAANSKYPDAANVAGENFTFLPINRTINFDDRAALSQPLAVDTGQSVPAGWKLVPIEPTETMLDAAIKGDEAPSLSLHEDSEEVAAVWSAMLAATPAPSVSPDPAGEVELCGLRILHTTSRCTRLRGHDGDCGVIWESGFGQKPIASSPIPKTFPREAVEKALYRARHKVGHVEIAAMDGDNLAVTLCSHFDDGGEADENGWSQAASEGCDATLTAIHQVYADAIAALLQEDRQS